VIAAGPISTTVSAESRRARPDDRVNLLVGEKVLPELLERRGMSATPAGRGACSALTPLGQVVAQGPPEYGLQHFEYSVHDHFVVVRSLL